METLSGIGMFGFLFVYERHLNSPFTLLVSIPELVHGYYMYCSVNFVSVHLKLSTIKWFFKATFWSTRLGNQKTFRIQKSRNSHISILFRNVERAKRLKEIKMVVSEGQDCVWRGLESGVSIL